MLLFFCVFTSLYVIDGPAQIEGFDRKRQGQVIPDDQLPHKKKAKRGNDPKALSIQELEQAAVAILAGHREGGEASAQISAASASGSPVYVKEFFFLKCGAIVSKNVETKKEGYYKKHKKECKECEECEEDQEKCRFSITFKVTSNDTDRVICPVCGLSFDKQPAGCVRHIKNHKLITISNGNYESKYPQVVKIIS